MSARRPFRTSARAAPKRMKRAASASPAIAGTIVRLREQELDEGDLDLDRMFADVGRRVGHTVGARGQERRDDLPVHGGGSQGGPESVARVEGDLPEAGGCVVGSQDDDHLIGLVCDLIVAVGADLAGVDVAGMRDDDGERFFRLRRECVLHEFFNGEPEDGRRFRVELPRHGRRDGPAPLPFRPGRPRRAPG